MKTYKYLMELFLSDENYFLAVKNVTKHKGGKKKKYRRARFYRDHAEELKPQLIDYALHFQNAEHYPKQIYDGVRRKIRTIIVPTMREQIIHHMIVNVLKPIFLKSMYEHSYGSLPDRGSHLAKRHIEKWIRKDSENTKYCLKMDIKKYFESIPHSILKEKFAKLIKDKQFLAIIYEIINAVPKDKGIPLGFYTSQWIANWYLTELDHYIKEELGAKYYVRYMDDMVIFGADKAELHRIRTEIECYIETRIGLQLKDNWQIFLLDNKDTHVGRDLDFMGFRFYRDKTVLRKAIMIRMTRKARRVSRKQLKTVHDCRQALSYLGWIDCTDTYGMYKKHIKPYVNIQYMKRRESKYERKVNKLCGEDVKIVA